MKVASLFLFISWFYSLAYAEPNSSYDFRLYIANNNSQAFKLRSYNAEEGIMRPIDVSYDYFRLDLPGEHLKIKDGFTDLEASLTSYAATGKVPKKKSWDGEQYFFPVIPMKNGKDVATEALIEMDLLKPAQHNQLKLLRFDKLSKKLSRELPQKSEGKLIEPCSQCGINPKGIKEMLGELADYLRGNDEEDSVPLEIIIRPKIPPKEKAPEICTTDIKALNEIFPKNGSIWGLSKSKCIEQVRIRACNNSMWKKKDVRQKYNSILETTRKQSSSKKTLSKFHIDPFILPCIAAKETSTLEPSMRTLSACGKNKAGRSNAGNYTASGLFQVTQTLMGDILRRRMRISYKKHPASMEVFRKHISDEEIRYLNNMDLSSRKECKDYPKCKELLERLWYAMPQDIELQVTLALIGLETTGSIARYHGGSDKKLIHEYEQRISSCHDCSRKMPADKKHECLVLAAASNSIVFGYNDRNPADNSTNYYEDLEDANKRKRDRYCKKGGKC